MSAGVFDLVHPGGPERLGTLDLGRGSVVVEAEPGAYAYLPSRGLAVLATWVQDDGAGVGALPAVVGVAVDAGGRPREAGRYVTDAPVRRVLTMGTRLAAVTEASVVLLDPAGLQPLGSLVLDPGYARADA